MRGSTIICLTTLGISENIKLLKVQVLYLTKTEMNKSLIYYFLTKHIQ